MEHSIPRYRPVAIIGRLITWAIALLPLGIFGLLLWLSIVPGRLTHFFLAVFLYIVVGLNVGLSSVVQPIGIAISVLLLIGVCAWLGSVIENRETEDSPKSGSAHRSPSHNSKKHNSKVKWVFLIDLAVMGVAIALLNAEMPLKWAFAYSQPRFEQMASPALLAASNPELFENLPEETVAEDGASATRVLSVELTLKPYHIDMLAYRADGSAYFRLEDPLYVSEREFYGFAYRPQQKGTPFGGGYEPRRSSTLHPLNEDWYWFRDTIGSDDWRAFSSGGPILTIGAPKRSKHWLLKWASSF
ncbi:MAG: hypothetical protein WBA57_07325 [Elainellaceae cyanobacterium]